MHLYITGSGTASETENVSGFQRLSAVAFSDEFQSPRELSNVLLREGLVRASEATSASMVFMMAKSMQNEYIAYRALGAFRN